MPYITTERRIALDNEELQDVGYKANTPGDMNYAISSIINDYLKNKGMNYDNLNAMVGVLDCAKMELYRIMAAPYEDKKMYENGPVYKGANA